MRRGDLLYGPIPGLEGLPTTAPRFHAWDVMDVNMPDGKPWASVAASELNISAVVFLTMRAASCSFLTHPIHHTFDEYPFSALTLPESDNLRIAQLMNSSANGYKNKERFWECMERSSNIVLIKTFRVMEAKSLISEKEGGDCWASSSRTCQQGRRWTQDHGDRRQLSSAVLVSSGSEYFLSEEEREEIAYGLELSNVGFIWVLKFHGGGEVTVHEALSQGFLQRIGHRGLVVEGWAPQAKILGHPGIGEFVSHCGWSSTLEAILLGVPIIAMPMHLDQPLNAKLAVEIGAVMEVDRGSGGFRREEVARVIQQVMVEEKGQEAKRNAQELGERMREEQEEMDGAVEKLKQLIEV
ncbi:UDP-glucosyltransferase 29-like [Rhodamnia argentea]|uniref:UDP-glucosyltransferase 29-like n=1 Tax=Rhodamnia argentea TaxID=178133 RepID=A0ABM3HJB0_9MYRT|nr:UDP-glucosyltransferase 29-like [Rhodamnia argentea]